MTEAEERQRESRRLCAPRGPWKRWVAEWWPLGPDGQIPDVPDAESVARGRERHRQVWDWIERDGKYPWPDND